MRLPYQRQIFLLIDVKQDADIFNGDLKNAFQMIAKDGAATHVAVQGGDFRKD